jgi:hypothetical protein
MQHVETANLPVKNVDVIVGEEGIGEGHSKRRARHEHQTPRGLRLDEALESRLGTTTKHREASPKLWAWPLETIKRGLEPR